MNEVVIRTVNLPVTISAYTALDSDGDYNIYINARISLERQMIAYRHELKHIERGDYYKNDSADLIEIYAHKVF